jgi:hypothetical protein
VTLPSPTRDLHLLRAPLPVLPVLLRLRSERVQHDGRRGECPRLPHRGVNLPHHCAQLAVVEHVHKVPELLVQRLSVGLVKEYELRPLLATDSVNRSRA